jgi:Ankyrin repeats (3 copies)/Ankyrin repeat
MVYKPNPNLLFDAAQYGHISAIHKAYVVGTDMNSCDTSGLTALHLAAIYQTDAVAQTLLNLGASHSVTTKVKQTPLYYAARYDNPDVLHTLLDAGANINAQDEIGNTALHVAVYMGNTSIVQELLLRGASKLLENRDGHTAEDFAATRGFADITPFVALTAEEQTQRVKWVAPAAPAPAAAAAPDPKMRHKGPQWCKPAPDQPPTNPDPLTKTEYEFLESLPFYFINFPQVPAECAEFAPLEWP